MYLNIVSVIRETMKSSLKKIRDILYFFEAFFIRKWNQWRNPSFACSSETERCTYNRKSQYFRYEYFGDNTPVCCASHLYCILKDVASVLERYNIEYFIFFGTLLGGVRHQGLIPWDTDVDIVIKYQDIERTLEILQSELGGQYHIEDQSSVEIAGGLLRVFFSQINTLHVDLFAYIQEEEDIVFAYYRKIKKETLFPLTQVKLYEKNFWAPNNATKHLQAIYGDNCMTYAYKQFALVKYPFKLKDFMPAKVHCK